MRTTYPGERVRILEREVGVDLGRRQLLRVILHDERGQSLGRLGESRLGIKATGAETPSATHRHDADGVAERIARNGEHVGVALVIGRHHLLRLQFLECADLIAQGRGALEFESSRGLFHALRKSLLHLVVATLEHLHGRLDVARVLGLRDQPHTRR